MVDLKSFQTLFQPDHDDCELSLSHAEECSSQNTLLNFQGMQWRKIHNTREMARERRCWVDQFSYVFLGFLACRLQPPYRFSWVALCCEKTMCMPRACGTYNFCRFCSKSLCTKPPKWWHSSKWWGRQKSVDNYKCFFSPSCSLF